jgi:hypothetical protein
MNGFFLWFGVIIVPERPNPGFLGGFIPVGYGGDGVIHKDEKM